MQTLVISGDTGHDARAKALATTLNTTSESVQQSPRHISKLERLIFWGHGDVLRFCGLKSEEFVDLIAAWKKKNDKLSTIEMLTCNVRHRQGSWPDSYTEQVVSKLTKKHRDLTFRGLPVAKSANGKTCQFSILKWHPGTATWAYIAGPGVDDTQMTNIEVKLEDQLKPRGAHDGYVRAWAALKDFLLTPQHPYATKRNYIDKDVKEYNDALKKAKIESFVMAGTVGMLRWCLEDLN